MPLFGSSRSASPTSSNSETARSELKHGGTDSPTYRTAVLKPNGIVIQHNSIPDDVQAAVNSILAKNSEDSSLSEADAHRITVYAHDVESASASAVASILGQELFPRPPRTGTSLAAVERLAFDTDAMPQAPPIKGLSFIHPAGVNPRPDLLYGFGHQAFSAAQDSAQNSVDLRSGHLLSRTALDLYWGFFTVEFVAQATGGTMWIATNQCAGGSAACVNALHQMFKLAKGAPCARPDSMCFSMAVDGQMAYLHVTWFDSGSFICNRIRYYVLFKKEGVRDLKRDVESIIQWGISARLTAVRGALDTHLSNMQKS